MLSRVLIWGGLLLSSIESEVQINSNMIENVVRLSHGSGGRASAEFIRDQIAPHFPDLGEFEDAAIIKSNAVGLTFTTDSFVIDPLFFPGGDIGELSVYGTINDLASQGSKAGWLSLALVIEEGLEMKTLLAVVKSAARATKRVGVKLVTGDTKVVEKGAIDKLIVNTAGVGEVLSKGRLDSRRITPGDEIVVSGDIGAHGMAVLSHRHKLGFDMVKSDCGPVNRVGESLINELESGVKWLRDPTRGGLATVLNELAAMRGAVIEIKETEVPVKKSVKSASEILGLDPLYLACEGRLVIVVEKNLGSVAVECLKRLPESVDSAVIGSVHSVDGNQPQVQLETKYKSRRLLRYLAADEQPRIC